MKNSLSFIAVIAVGVLYFIYIGWVFSDLWNWFLTPLGMIEITKTHAIGILLIVALAKGNNPIPKNKDTKTQMYAFAFSPLFSWLIGYFLVNNIGI